MRRLLIALGAGVAPLLSPTAPGPGPRTTPDPAAYLRAESCSLCHVDAVRGLLASAHAALGAGACADCHGDLSAHAAAALDPAAEQVPPPPVAVAACAACHRDRAFADTAGGRHLWQPQAARPRPGDVVLPPGPLPQPGAAQLADSAGALGMRWSGLARAGYRFVSVFGSRERYETDLDLDRGWRLLDLELTGERPQRDALVDRVELRLHDLADPWMQASAEVSDDDGWTAAGSYRRDRYKYRASGDFHRVDVRGQETAVRLSHRLSDELSLHAGFTRRSQDGFWLTNRIGDRNAPPPQTTVAGVASPRRLDADLVEVSAQARLLGASVRAGVEYRDERTRDRWSFAMPAATNPAFPDSEDFASDTTTRGPGGRLGASRAFGPLTVSADARWLDLDRRVLGAGVRRGFDVGEYVTTTAAGAEGYGRTWLVDSTASLALSEATALDLDLRWIDHRERMRIDQTDTTVFPGTGGTTVVTTQLDQQSTQRVFEGSLSVATEPLDGLHTQLGYGFSREWLKVPDLEPADPDFRRGLIRSDGAFADVEWRPDDRWVLGGRWRGFGQNGPQLHEVIDEHTREMRLRLRRQLGEVSFVELYTRNRRKENAVSRTVVDAWTSGITAGADLGDDLDGTLTYSYTDLESRTLTTFWFDPSPLPVPTFVGYDGDTHTMAVTVGWHLTRNLRAEAAGTYAGTRGTFDVQMFDWRLDLAARVYGDTEVGCLLRQTDYRQGPAAGRADDFTAYTTFAYVRAGW